MVGCFLLAAFFVCFFEVVAVVSPSKTLLNTFASSSTGMAVPFLSALFVVAGDEVQHFEWTLSPLLVGAAVPCYLEGAILVAACCLEGALLAAAFVPCCLGVGLL
jgi:hypothetical protein